MGLVVLSLKTRRSSERRSSVRVPVSFRHAAADPDRHDLGEVDVPRAALEAVPCRATFDRRAQHPQYLRRRNQVDVGLLRPSLETRQRVHGRAEHSELGPTTVIEHPGEHPASMQGGDDPQRGMTRSGRALVERFDSLDDVGDGS